MTAGIRRLREGLDDEVPLHYEGLPLRAGVRIAAWAGGFGLVVTGILGMTRGGGTALEPVGAFLGALGVVSVVVPWRFRLHELIAGERWLIVRCGPIVHRFGRTDVEIGADGPASSWRRLYGGREVPLRALSHDSPLTVPVDDIGGLREVVARGSGDGP